MMWKKRVKVPPKDSTYLFDALGTNMVLQSFYIDDYLKTFESAKMALFLYHNLKAKFQVGCFRLTKWISNS